MPQVQVRDEDGRPIPDINVRFCLGEIETPQIADGIFDYKVDADGNQTWPIPYWPDDQAYTFHANSGAPGSPQNPMYEVGVAHAAAGYGDNVVIVLKKKAIVSGPVEIRTGVVVQDGRALRDDQGLIRPLGCTFFWAMQGMKFEPNRIPQYIDYLAAKLGNHFNRILGQVDWPGWEIDPDWPDYEAIMGQFVDLAYARGGQRTQITLCGGDNAEDVVMQVARQFVNVYRGREHKFISAEVVNERTVHQKMTEATMEKAGKFLHEQCPQLLIGLSTPIPKKTGDDTSGYAGMREAMKRTGTNVMIQHPRRTKWEYGWDNVSQMYDADAADPFIAWINEPAGPQSSVFSEMRPHMLAASRFVSLVCSAPTYVFHPGQMVTGHVDPNHGRPAELWEVPGIEAMMAAVRAAQTIVPDGVENWTVRNNRRDDHPLPLPDAAFWSDSDYADTGWVNKNYAAIHSGGFVEHVCGLRAKVDGNLLLVGRAHRSCAVEAFDPITLQIMASTTLNAGQDFFLPGKAVSNNGQDLLSSYFIRGRYL